MNTAIKPFNEVGSGDEGFNYADESGLVIHTGTYFQLKKYDTTGACQELENDPDSKHQLNKMVAVQMEDGDILLYVYGSDGFAVYI